MIVCQDSKVLMPSLVQAELPPVQALAGRLPLPREEQEVSEA